MTRRTRRNPQLKFGPTTTRQGFTHYSMSSFGDLRPARIVRELIQNSLDAAVEAGEATARVRFKATLIGPEEVPDVAGYKRAFRSAVEDQTRMDGELSDAAQQVACRNTALAVSTSWGVVNLPRLIRTPVEASS